MGTLEKVIVSFVGVMTPRTTGRNRRMMEVITMGGKQKAVDVFLEASTVRHGETGKGVFMSRPPDERKNSRIPMVATSVEEMPQPGDK